MASPRRTTKTPDPVVVKLLDGHYDRELAEFRAQLQAATDALWRMHEAMRAENTLQS